MRDESLFMPESKFEIVELKSGIKSLRLIDNQETFHPGIGPVAEARILHVEQQRLTERLKKSGRLVIWDVGLGAAANAVAALEALKDCAGQVEIHSFDKTLEPLQFGLQHTEHLDYLAPYEPVLSRLLQDGVVQVNPRIRWYLHLGDFREQMLRTDLPVPQAIFYDPYSPSSNVEMWTLEHFKKLRQRLDGVPPCLLSNYTRSTLVRVTWLMAGFIVGVGTAIGDKEEATLASNSPVEIHRPLSREFLKKVYLSHASAPLRGQSYAIERISEEDFEVLQLSEQFRRAPFPSQF